MWTVKLAETDDMMIFRQKHINATAEVESHSRGPSVHEFYSGHAEHKKACE
jgi:hypothetical protein